MDPSKLIGRRGRVLDTLREPRVSCPLMSRGLTLLLLACAVGCSSAAPPNQMAPTPKADPPAERQAQPASAPAPAPAPATNTSGEIAARINNEIITWKDVKEVLKEIKPGDLSMELKKSKLRDMAEEKMFLQAAR